MNKPCPTPTDERTQPRSRRRKEARPGELLDAALELFVEHGFAATKVEAVARRAGVSKGTLFLYFPSKEDLFKAVVRHHLAGLFPAWDSEVNDFEGHSAELVRYALEQWWLRIGATPASGITKLIMAEARQFPDIANFYQEEVIRPAHRLLGRILQRGIDRGEFRPMNVDYGIYGLIAPMMFLVLWRHAMAPCAGEGTGIDPVTFIATQTDTLLEGLCVRPPVHGVETGLSVK